MAEMVQYLPGSCVSVRTLNIRQYSPHWHDTDLEVVFVLAGKVSANVVYDTFEINEGDFLVINQEDVHTLHSREDNVTCLINIDLKAFEEKYEYIMFLDLLCESFNTNPAQREYIQQLKKIFAKVILETSKSREKKQSAYVAEAMEILLSHFDFANYCNDKPIHGSQLQRYYRIMKHISQNYDEKISIEALSNEEFIGKNYMSQFWKKMLGLNFTDYLNSRRCEVAEKLLLTTSLSLQEISLRCGFSDTKYFYKNFKKWYGSTPFEHKKRYMALINKTGNLFEELPLELVRERFGTHLINLLVDEDCDILQTAKPQQEGRSWRVEFEKHITASMRRMKLEILKETQKTLGLRELFLPLLDDEVVKFSGGELNFDWNFIGEVIKYSKEMNYVICIDINYLDRTVKEWKLVIERFASFVISVMGKDALSRFKFYIFLAEGAFDWEAEELVQNMEQLIDMKNIQVAVRYR